MSTAAETILVTIARAIEAKRGTGRTSREIAEEVMFDLDRAGYVTRKKPKPRAAAKPGSKLLPLPTSPGHAAVGKLTENRREAMERDWSRAVKVAEGDIASGRPSPAEAALQQTIAIHRSPWSFTGTYDARTYRSREHGYVIQQRHASDGKAMHLIDPDGHVVGHFYTFRDAESAIPHTVSA